MNALYDTDMGDQTLDVSASSKKFQTSIIVQQDPNKDGIISFLEIVEQELTTPPTSTSPQTMRPNSGPDGGGGSSVGGGTSAVGSSGGGGY